MQKALVCLKPNYKTEIKTNCHLFQTVISNPVFDRYGLSRLDKSAHKSSPDLVDHGAAFIVKIVTVQPFLDRRICKSNFMDFRYGFLSCIRVRKYLNALKIGRMLYWIIHALL